jgi:hypothetical protein
MEKNKIKKEYPNIDTTNIKIAYIKISESFYFYTYYPLVMEDGLIKEELIVAFNDFKIVKIDDYYYND